MGWDAVDPNRAADPVPGDTVEFAAAAHDAWTVAGDLAQLAAATRNLLGPAEAAWQGTAATAFGTQVAGLVGALGASVPIADGLAATWRTHVDALADLRAQADAALVRALARHAALEAKTAELAAARRALAVAERQLATARAAAATAEPLDVAAFEQRVVDRRAAAASRQAAVHLSTDEVTASRAEYHALNDAAAALATATVRALDGLTPPPLDLDERAATRELPQGVFATLADRVVAVAERVMDVALVELAEALTRQLLPFPLGGLLPVDRWVAALGDDRERRAALLTALVELHRRLSGAPRHGDLDGTYDWAARGAWPQSRATGSAAGSATVHAALTLLRDSRTLAPDEFGVVELDDDRVIVVLPGVTDLSNPDWGWNDAHRTVRDLDAAAYESSKSTSVSGNRYARMVAAGLAAFGVAPGTELLIVGHSFGADTALDLAADAHFNGADGYRVTHVVAAGYHSQPQLRYVPPATSVLVLQNDGDVAIELERFAEHPARFEEQVTDGWGDLFDGNPVGVVAALSGAANEALGFGGYLLEEAAGMDPIAPLPLPGRGARDPAPTRVATPSEHVVVARFDGPDAGLGHHPDNYVAFFEQPLDPAVAAFTADLAAVGFAGAGQIYAIDVSVPRHHPRRGSW